MEIIDLLNLVSDPSVLKKHINGNVIVKNLENSSLKLLCENGVCSFVGHELGNVDPWLSLLDHEIFHTLHIRCCDTPFMRRLPSNISNLHFTDYSELERVRSWVHAYDLRKENRSLIYNGKYTENVPLFQEKITENLTHFILPLRQDISQMKEINPHIKTFGVDFDYIPDRNIFEDDHKLVLWSSHPHSYYFAKVRYPQHEHRMHKFF